MAGRGARLASLLAVLVAGLAVGLFLGAIARADGPTCGTAGDLSFCAQWGVKGFATRLQVKDTGSQTISSFTFALPSGATVTGAAGNTGCTYAQPAPNDVTCSTPTAPGQQQFVDILSSSVPVGSTGTLTLKDSHAAAQPAQSLKLQATAVCGLAGHVGADCPTTTQAECDWKVRFANPPAEVMAGERIKATIVVSNAGSAACPAATLNISRNNDTAAARDYYLGAVLKTRTADAKIPALAAGASASTTVEPWRPNAETVIWDWPSSGRLTLTASMPLDPDGGPSDETAAANIEIVTVKPTSRKASVTPAGSGTEPFDCGLAWTQTCTLSGKLDTGSCAAGPNQDCGESDVCTPSAEACGPTPPKTSSKSGTSAIQVIGKITGSVKGQANGTLTIQLYKAGQRLLQAHHKVRERMLLTVRSGSGDVAKFILPITLILSS